MISNSESSPAPLERRLDIRRFGSRDALFIGLAAHIATVFATAIAHTGRATAVLSGGSTPAELYPRLARQPVSWSQVVLTLSDERWVPATDPASNAAMVGRTLLTGPAGSARFVGLYEPQPSPELGLSAAQARLHAAGLPPFDLVLLGMGEDGHTASLFPGGEGLETALAPPDGALVAGVVPAGGGPARISLTLPALLSARQIVLCITGEPKRGVLMQALQPGPVETMPIRAILNQTAVPLSIWWAI